MYLTSYINHICIAILYILILFVLSFLRKPFRLCVNYTTGFFCIPMLPVPPVASLMVLYAVYLWVNIFLFEWICLYISSLSQEISDDQDCCLDESSSEMIKAPLSSSSDSESSTSNRNCCPGEKERCKFVRRF